MDECAELNIIEVVFVLRWLAATRGILPSPAPGGGWGSGDNDSDNNDNDDNDDDND